MSGWQRVQAVLAFTVLTIGLFGCGGKTVVIPPGSRLIMQGDVQTWALCDRGNLIYVTGSGAMQIVPLGCVTGQP
jgi:hypothetical protein